MAFTCPVCHMVSHHPEDVKQGYCGNCHRFTREEDTHYLLCPPTDQPPLVPAERRWCNTCGEEVWVSLVMLGQVDGGYVEVRCALCMAATESIAKEPPIWAIHPAQRQSLIQRGQLAAHRRDVEDLNRASRRRRK